MLLTHKRIAIIGGGPGGLTLARLLQQKGADVKVYERDENRDVRVQGATLDLHFHTGLKALKAAGLIDTFKTCYRPGADKGRVVDEQGAILYDEHNEPSIDDFDSECARPEIDRGPLRDMLLDALHPDTVVWNSQFHTMSQTDDAWILTFKNGTTATADIVIGADGVNSKVRPFVTSLKPYYSGITIVEGNVFNAETTVPNIYKLLQNGKLYTFNGGKYLHVSSKGDGSLVFYVSTRIDENWVQTSGINLTDRNQIVAWFKNKLPEWGNIWSELYENVSLPVTPRPQYCLDIDQPWPTLPNLTLLGDAAHPMPASGEGVNLAMLDALQLSECLTGNEYTDLQTAIAAYEKLMRERAVNAMQGSLGMVEWMHAEGALAKMVALLQPTL